MSFLQDKQIRRFVIFMISFGVMTLCAGLLFTVSLSNAPKSIYVSHDEAVASSLLQQGIPKEVIADALLNTEADREGRKLVAALGLGMQSANDSLPLLGDFRKSVIKNTSVSLVLLLIILYVGTFIFFWHRKRLYLQAEKVIENYINGDFSWHLPHNSEGAVFRMFASVEQLATMLQAKSDTEHKTKEFLKSTISDISHQLKTPLAAITMYQEIIADEPDNEEAVRKFSGKIGMSLKRMEDLIQSMLKITRLDTESIVFEKNEYNVSELISRSISELTDRAGKEQKQIIIEGNPEQLVICDLEWTSEAVGNLVKNALDHTKPGDTIRISWEQTPAILRLFICDTGAGIAPEDIHHIFKRFYRSKHSLDTQGIGLGLPLAKSIIEGQGGLLSVQSKLNEGTIFTISLLTES
ncbi:HAMP domain-containing histidine kinase [Blautia schinkii]|nr:HAMP domain-containing histidine kinase [Blautia schinkii]